MKRKQWGRIVLPIALAASMLGGCGMFGSDDTGDNAEPTTLKVMYYDERSFYDQYGMLFYALHPEVEIEVVSTQSVKWEEGKDMNAAMAAFIDEEQPDIVMLSTEQYTKLAEEGKLMDLEARVADKRFEQEGLMPGMLDYLRDLSGGTLYGLVPDFYSQALFYNKDLFDKFGVDLPTDKMSWDELFRLAAMFPADGSGEDRVYGLKLGYSGSDLYQLANMIGMTQNLNIVDAGGTQVTINSDAWKQAFETADTALKSGALYVEDPMSSGSGAVSYEEFLLRDPFIGGKAAMTMDGTFIMGQIKQAQDVVKDKAIQNWDIVTLPVDPSNPDYSPFINFNNIFAIYAKTAAADAAWSFLSYIHSDEFARVTSKRQQGYTSVRTKYAKDDEGHNYAAFYALKPMQSAMNANYAKLPTDFMMQFMNMTRTKFANVTEGEQRPIADVLDELQAEAQDALTLAIQQRDSSPPPASTSTHAAVESTSEAVVGK